MFEQNCSGQRNGPFCLELNPKVGPGIRVRDEEGDRNECSLVDSSISDNCRRSLDPDIVSVGKISLYTPREVRL